MDEARLIGMKTNASTVTASRQYGSIVLWFYKDERTSNCTATLVDRQLGDLGALDPVLHVERFPNLCCNHLGLPQEPLKHEQLLFIVRKSDLHAWSPRKGD